MLCLEVMSSKRWIFASVFIQPKCHSLLYGLYFVFSLYEIKPEGGLLPLVPFNNFQVRFFKLPKDYFNDISETSEIMLENIIAYIDKIITCAVLNVTDVWHPWHVLNNAFVRVGSFILSVLILSSTRKPPASLWNIYNSRAKITWRFSK